MVGKVELIELNTNLAPDEVLARIERCQSFQPFVEASDSPMANPHPCISHLDGRHFEFQSGADRQQKKGTRLSGEVLECEDGSSRLVIEFHGTLAARQKWIFVGGVIVFPVLMLFGANGIFWGLVGPAVTVCILKAREDRQKDTLVRKLCEIVDSPHSHAQEPANRLFPPETGRILTIAGTMLSVMSFAFGCLLLGLLSWQTALPWLLLPVLFAVVCGWRAARGKSAKVRIEK